MQKRTARKQENLLQQVSRSFYLTLRILPGGIRRQIGLAYLLARTTDTIADTALVTVERRIDALRSLRAAIQTAAEGQDVSFAGFSGVTGGPDVPSTGSSAEHALLERSGAALEALKLLSPRDRLHIKELLDVITSGQELDLIRFGRDSGDHIIALDSDAELDDYTYRVAGCVGEFWTEMCVDHLFGHAGFDKAFLLCSGVRLGKGLQLVNILRDLPRDLGSGRCYIPVQALAGHGLLPSDLINPGNMNRFRSLYNNYLRRAEGWLSDGWLYIKALPPGHMRVRLACAWPVLIGIRTISRLRAGNVLDPRERIKVSRSEVRQLLLRSLLSYPRVTAWDRLLDFARQGGSEK